MEQPSISQVTAKQIHHMRDVSDEVLRGLKVLGDQAETRDPWLIYILVSKLDAATKHNWAQHSFGTEFPTIQQFFEFLNKESDTLESCEPTKRTSRQVGNSNLKVMHADVQLIRCPKCSQTHYLRNCEDFLQLSVHDRRNFVAENKLCFICMFKNHQSQNCRSKFRCSICKAKHHTTLHQEVNRSTPNSTVLSNETVTTTSNTPHSTIESVNVAHTTTTKAFTALLPTAIIGVLDSSKQYQRCRVLLDSGAQASFISESFAQRLALPRKNTKVLIQGITSGTEATRGTMTVRAKSVYSSDETIDVDVLIINKLTHLLPSRNLKNVDYRRIKNLQLADPYFDKPGVVDMIIGADRFFNILREGRINNISNQLTALNSMFGWILSGEIKENTEQSIAHSYHIGLNVDETLKKFWEMEEMPSHDQYTPEENRCEDHFKTNVVLHENGKYIVKLPFKHPVDTLGNSLNIAKNRFISLEHKLNRDLKLKADYINIIREYISLGHMERVSNITSMQNHYYLPHHAVTKEESATTKLRVVFDGSSKTTNGNSINDILMVGPTIQPTLWTTLLKFRYNRIALTADIEKMYRQVMVARDDQEFQRILWREDESEPLLQYRLTTVTFGMASSAYLAIRSLQQTALDFQQDYPIIHNEIMNKFYIDDYLSGADTVADAIYLKNKMTYTLRQRGFHLRKWKSNAAEVLDQPIAADEMEVHIEETNSTTKILGLKWNSQDDTLSFKVQLPEESIATKRTLISHASQVFDPLGLLSPAIIIAKILYQKLWLKKLDWDDELPDDIAIIWRQLKAELPQLERLKIPRYINKKTIQIHGFCDASERAYAAVLYSRFKDENGEMSTELITSKTKVAPIKQVSLPRLELCGAHLLAKLICEVRKTLSEDIPIYGWTDSTIVLAWLSDHPTKWKTFVANRVSAIQDLLPRNHWHHISSENNPADYASRGVLPCKLLTLHQWWHGPKWLIQPEQSWPILKQQIHYDSTICELKKNSCAIPLLYVQQCETSESEIYESILSKTFSFSKAIRIMCFIYRFIENCRTAKGTRRDNGITLSEINNATNSIIKWVQGNEYRNEIKILSQNRSLLNSNKLSSLSPFLDKNGLLRVGGRLRNADYSYDFKHPIILPNSHILSKMIISFFHRKNLHPGPSHTSHLIRQTYWIVQGRAVIRNEIRKCIECFKNKAKTSKQLMGDLPSVRITPARPFSNCGVDYAGPIILASKKGRGAKMIKGYIAIFVCMATKALHIEAVTDLTTDAFIAALKRFSSRRNVPINIYSDNGTNFTGANRQLKEVILFNNSKTNDSVITEFCAHHQINWHHIPPYAPHFGGLWESAVKSVKTHLNRVTGSCHLTFEEMSTLLCQIEGILNSRPLCPISEDDESFEALLTPAHFLTGSTLEAVPQHDLSDITSSKLSRWQQVEQRTKSFWKRFHNDYLNNLQQRNKWKSNVENLKLGDLVLLKEDNLPTCKWALGRVNQIHSDERGQIRVVTVKTASNTIKMPISRICKVPVD